MPLEQRLIDDVTHVGRTVQWQAQDVVDLAVIEAAIVIDVELRAAHDMGDGGAVVVVREQPVVRVVGARSEQLAGKAPHVPVVHRVQPVELHALGMFELVAVEILQIGLVGRQEGPVDVIGQVDLQLGVDTVAKCVHVAQHLHDAREATGSALLVHAGGIEVGHRGDELDLVLDVDVLEMRVFGIVQDDEVRAHDHLLGDPGRLPDEPFELRVHLRRAASYVHDLEPAGLEGGKHRLHGLARHALLVLGRAGQIAVVAGEIAAIGDVDLHGVETRALE